MSNNNLTQKEITILKTWDWEVFEIDMRYEDYLIFESSLKKKKEDWFNSSKHRRYIKFATIKDKIWKTKHIALPEPKQEQKKLTSWDRKAIKKMGLQMLRVNFFSMNRLRLMKRN